MADTFVDAEGITAWATAQGASVDAVDGEPAPTQIALPEVAAASGTAGAAGVSITVAVPTATALGAAGTAALFALSKVRRVRAGAPLRAPLLTPGVPVRKPAANRSIS